jgi:hypothetical protein
MDRYVFAKHIVITNDQGGGRAVILQILGSFPDDSSGKDLVVFTESSFARDVRVRSDITVWPYCDIPVDYGVGSNGYSRV